MIDTDFINYTINKWASDPTQFMLQETITASMNFTI